MGVLSATMFEEPDAVSLSSLAVFPLPNAVLLPGSLLPLHVFEARYREMTRDALAGDRLIGIARLCPGFEADYHGRPPIQPHLGIGRIIASEELPDGRYHILLRGLCRGRVHEEHPAVHSYRTVRAVALRDCDTRRPEALKAGHQQLIALCDRLSMTLDSGGEQLRQLVRSEASASNCVDLVTGALVTDIEERQRLLEALDPLDRLARAVAHVGRLLVECAPCSGVPN